MAGAGNRIGRLGLHLGWLAGVLFGASVLAAGATLTGFDHARHSLGLLGSALAAHALAFNAIGFGVSGLCLAGFALALERSWTAQGVGRSGRLATHLLVISGLAFAAQAGFPFDPVVVDGAQSRRHVFAYAIVLLAWLPSTVLTAWAVRGRHAWRGLSWLGVAFAVAWLVCLFFPVDHWLPGWGGKPGYAQRLIFLLYFTWPALLSAVALRGPRSGDA